MRYTYWTYSLLSFYCLWLTKAVQFYAYFQTPQCNFSWNGVLGWFFLKYTLQELFSQSLKTGLYFLAKRSSGKKKRRKIAKIYSFHMILQYLNSLLQSKMASARRACLEAAPLEPEGDTAAVQQFRLHRFVQHPRKDEPVTSTSQWRQGSNRGLLTD